jgi:hypothetical protein
MALDAILGGALGALARLAPEVLKHFDRKNERKHEVVLGQQQMELVKYQGDNKLRGEQVQADAAQMTAGLEAIKVAYESQKTGFKFADTVSALVRPIVTYVVFGGWVSFKIAAYMQLSNGDITWAQAVQSSWTENDWAMLSGILNFWFLGRVFDKKG